ncbi:MAG: hypothetical protein AB1918_14480 [Pseudomonadota bacterium]
MATENLITPTAYSTALAAIIASAMAADMIDEEAPGVDAAIANMVDELIDQRGGVATAADKLRLVVTRMRDALVCEMGGEDDQRDFRLIESALLDLLASIQ